MNLNVDERSESGKMIVQMSDCVDSRRDVPNSQLGRERALGSEASTSSAAATSNPAKHGSAPARQSVVVKALLWRVRVELRGKLVEWAFPV